MVKFKVFQVKDNLTREYGYLSLSMLKGLQLNVNINNYNLVYEGNINNFNNCNEALEKLFVKFNNNHPQNYFGRSMSVSDIVQIKGDYYYCDSVGWSKVDCKAVI